MRGLTASARRGSCRRSTLVQADRFRRKVAKEMARVFTGCGPAAGAFTARRDAGDY